MKYETLMQEALIEAGKARDDGDWAIGCVIALDGEVIARGRNRVRSTRNRLAHAEIEAISEIQSDHFEHDRNNEMVVVSTFETCPMCFGAVILNGIRTVVSGVNLDQSGASSLVEALPPHFQQPRYATRLVTGILQRDCAEMWMSSDPAQSMLLAGQGKSLDIRTLTNDGPIVTYETTTHNEPDVIV